MPDPAAAPAALPPVAFIGGGNMASAILGGLIRQGAAGEPFEVVEPSADARDRLAREFGIAAQAEAGPALARCAAGGLGRQAAELSRRPPQPVRRWTRRRPCT